MAIRVEALRMAAETCRDSASAIMQSANRWKDLFPRIVEVVAEMQAASIEIMTYLGDLDRREYDYSYLHQDEDSDEEIPRRRVLVSPEPTEEPNPEDGGDALAYVEDAKARVLRASGIVRAVRLPKCDRETILKALHEDDRASIESQVSDALTLNRTRRAQVASLRRDLREIIRLIEIGLS